MPIGKVKPKKQVFGYKEKENNDRNLNSSTNYLMDTSNNKMFEAVPDNNYRTQGKILDAVHATANPIKKSLKNIASQYESGAYKAFSFPKSNMNE